MKRFRRRRSLHRPRIANQNNANQIQSVLEVPTLESSEVERQARRSSDEEEVFLNKSDPTLSDLLNSPSIASHTRIWQAMSNIQDRHEIVCGEEVNPPKEALRPAEYIQEDKDFLNLTVTRYSQRNQRKHDGSFSK
jgi:hypothetical protein